MSPRKRYRVNDSAEVDISSTQIVKQYYDAPSVCVCVNCRLV